MTKVFQAVIPEEYIASGLTLVEENPDNIEFLKGLYSWCCDYFGSIVNPETGLAKWTEIRNCGIVRDKLKNWMYKTRHGMLASPMRAKKRKGFLVNSEDNPAKLRAKERQNFDEQSNL